MAARVRIPLGVRSESVRRPDCNDLASAKGLSLTPLRRRQLLRQQPPAIQCDHPSILGVHFSPAKLSSFQAASTHDGHGLSSDVNLHADLVRYSIGTRPSAYVRILSRSIPGMPAMAPKCRWRTHVRDERDRNRVGDQPARNLERPDVNRLDRLPVLLVVVLKYES